MDMVYMFFLVSGVIWFGIKWAQTNRVMYIVASGLFVVVADRFAGYFNVWGWECTPAHFNDPSHLLFGLIIGCVGALFFGALERWGVGRK